MTVKCKLIIALLALLAFTVSGGRAHAAKIGTICRLLGEEALHVEGQGIVTGLNGTGDKSDAARVMIKKYLEANKYNFALSDLSSKNIALVKIDATIKPYARAGDRITLRVSSLNDASSLKNGILSNCVLRFHTGGEAIIRGGGRVTVGDNPTTGIVSEGGQLLSAQLLNRRIVDQNGIFRLILERPNFQDSATIANNINNDPRTNPSKGRVYGFRDDSEPAQVVAHARDAKEIVVRIPEAFKDRIVEYISVVKSLNVPIESVAEVRVNRQTGIAIVTGDVQVQPGYISYRGRTVTLAQPANGGGIPRYDMENETPRSMVDVFGPFESGGGDPRGLQSLVDTLSAMRCTTDDIINILEKLKASGLIQANLVVE